MMIRDTSAQDRMVEVKPNRKRRLILGGIGIAVVALLVWLAPGIGRLFSASASVSSSRLAFATVERGQFVRDIAAEGKVVAAVSPTLYATYGGAVTLQVHAGDTVKKGQVLAVVDSPELRNKLAQEQSKADAMQVDYLQSQADARSKRSDLQKAFDNAQIDEKSAETNLSREQKASDAGAATGAAVDQAKDLLEKARITLAHAKSDLGMNNASLNLNIQSKKLAHENQLLVVQDLQRQVDDLNVKSPVDGQVGQLFIAERATVAKDAQLLSGSSDPAGRDDEYPVRQFVRPGQSEGDIRIAARIRPQGLVQSVDHHDEGRDVRVLRVLGVALRRGGVEDVRQPFGVVDVVACREAVVGRPVGQVPPGDQLPRDVLASVFRVPSLPEAGEVEYVAFRLDQPGRERGLADPGRAFDEDISAVEFGECRLDLGDGLVTADEPVELSHLAELLPVLDGQFQLLAGLALVINRRRGDVPGGGPAVKADTARTLRTRLTGNFSLSGACFHR